MSRFANLPLAVRLATAFGLQAVALLAGTDVRAVSLAGEVGQSVQAIGRLAADELYVRGGEREAIAALRRETQADVEQLSRLVGSDPNLVRFTGQLGPWNAALTKALTLDRAAARALYRAGIAPEMDGLQETMVALQRSVEDHTEATAAAVEADGRARAGAADRVRRLAAGRDRVRTADHPQRRQAGTRADGAPAQPRRTLPDRAHRRPRGRRGGGFHARGDAGHDAAGRPRRR